jgi:hypothetical protein
MSRFAPYQDPLKRNGHTLAPSRLTGNDPRTKENHCYIFATIKSGLWRGMGPAARNAAIAASRILAPGGERGSLINAHQWVPQEGADDERRSDDQRQKPICEVGHILPQRQLLSIIHVEGDQHQNV